MSFLNNAGVTTLWSRIKDYLIGSHVKTNVISGATDVDGALMKLQTKTGTAALTTQATNLSGAVNELNSELDSQAQQIANVKAAAAYVEDGDTASRTYTEGQFILWKGLLYTVKTGGLPQGETISATYLNAVTGGGLNAVNSKLPKYYFGSSQALAVMPNSLRSADVTIPSDATEVMAVIPYGANPHTHWNSIAYFFRGQTSFSKIDIWCSGSGEAQDFTIFYLVIYI